MHPLVSIIIPTYNRAHLIGETLDSVIAQTYNNWECIVVDDGSSDYTNELLEFYCEKDIRIQYHHRPENRSKGANACRNYGFILSKGEYIRWFDSDDITDQKYLELAIDIFKSNLEVDFVFCDYIVFDESGKSLIEQNNFSEKPLLQYFAGEINLATGSIIWKKKVVDNNSFDEDLRKTQELDFIFKIYKKEGIKKLTGEHVRWNGYFLRKHGKSIVSAFFNLDPEYLLSDIIVRTRIINYFNTTSLSGIIANNKKELLNTLNLYLLNCDLYHFFKFISKMDLISNDAIELKIKLVYYRMIYFFTNRNFRFKKTVEKIPNEEIYLFFNK